MTSVSAKRKITWYQDVENAILGRVPSEGCNIWSLVRIDGNWFIARAKGGPPVSSKEIVEGDGDTS